MAGKKKRRKPAKDGLFLRGSIWWANIHGARVTTGCKDREAARAVRAKLEREAADPAYAAAQKTRVCDMIEHVLADRARAKGKSGALLASATLQIYRDKLGHVARIFGDETPLGAVDYAGVGRYIVQRETEGASQHTIHKELKHLRFGLRLEQENGCYPHNIAHVTRVHRFAEGYEPRKRHLTWEEIPKLIGAMLQEQPHRVTAEKLARARELRAEGRTLVEMAKLMSCSIATAKRYLTMPDPEPSDEARVRAQHIAWYIATAGRDAESHRAELADHDLVNWTVHLRGSKTGKASATIAIAPPFRPLLAFALEGRPAEGPIFPNWANVGRSLAKACKRAGIERVSPNDLRRTHASLLKQSGVHNDDLKELLRHTTTIMVDRVYGKTNVQAVARSLENVPPVAGLLPGKKDGDRNGSN